jgi:general secretion pathway protein A
MYASFFGLREFPFSLTCEEKFFFESPMHKEALANMMYTVQQGKGMVLVTGEVGTGKTFVGNVLRNRLGPECITVTLKNPPQSGKQLLKAFASRIGVGLEQKCDKLDILEALEQHLIALQKRGTRVALILDETQNLLNGTLEEISMLWNWEKDGRKLVQIILIGQPELRDRLQEARWEPLRQRIVLSYHLQPLSAPDTAAYISHRLQIAADANCSVAFTPAAIAEIYAVTNGRPRLINVFCDNALLVAYAKGVRCIDPAIVAEVLRDMACWGASASDQAA